MIVCTLKFVFGDFNTFLQKVLLYFCMAQLLDFFNEVLKKRKPMASFDLKNDLKNDLAKKNSIKTIGISSVQKSRCM